MSQEETTEAVKWYTLARKFPQLIGKTPDGTRLWGGPYTTTQVVGCGAVLFIGQRTMSMWAAYGLVGNFCLLALIAYGTVLVLGRIPIGSRNPVAILAGTYRAVAAPTTGRLAGRSVKIRRPHVLQHRAVFALSTPAQVAVDEAVICPPTPVTAAPALTVHRAQHQPRRPNDPQPALTGLQTLLAGHGLPTPDQED